MTKTYELPNDKMLMADVDEKNHTATVSVYALDDLVKAVNKTETWECVLNKIRAEITAISISGQADEHTMFIRTGEQVKQMALGIIDKYKAEAEDT